MSETTETMTTEAPEPRLFRLPCRYVCPEASNLSNANEAAAYLCGVTAGLTGWSVDTRPDWDDEDRFDLLLWAPPPAPDGRLVELLGLYVGRDLARILASDGAGVEFGEFAPWERAAPEAPEAPKEGDRRPGPRGR
jgi:hypothetical protein